jgi:hypothetical protein
VNEYPKPQSRHHPSLEQPMPEVFGPPKPETFAQLLCFDGRAREKDMSGNLIHSKRKALVDGWPLLVGFALYWVALAYFALALASGILVA